MMKETKEVCALGITMLNGLGNAAKDNQFTLSDLGYFYPLIGQVPAAIDNINLVPDEIKTARPEDWSELVTWAEKEFDIPQDRVEIAVEAGLELGLSIYKTYQKWKQP